MQMANTLCGKKITSPSSTGAANRGNIFSCLGITGLRLWYSVLLMIQPTHCSPKQSMPVEIIDIKKEKLQCSHQAHPLAHSNVLRSVKQERSGGIELTFAWSTESDTILMEVCGPALSPKTDSEENRWMRMLFKCRVPHLSMPGFQVTSHLVCAWSPS